LTDFRAEAVQVYETTRSSDTRGIIAALLHLAETIAPASPSTERGGGPPGWQGAALSYLQGKQHRTKSVHRLARWLTEQGFDVDDDAVRRGMWELVEAGHVEANTSGVQPLFSAVPERR
jgi:hypothetical protein